MIIDEGLLVTQERWSAGAVDLGGAQGKVGGVRDATGSSAQDIQGQGARVMAGSLRKGDEASPGWAPWRTD